MNRSAYSYPSAGDNLAVSHGLPRHHLGDDAVVSRDLSKRYGRETALDRVGLRIPVGAVYILVGANGAGKSTTLKILMNLVRPDSGTVEVFGLDTTRRGAEVRAQVGYVPERHDPGYRWMTCGRLLQHASVYYPSWNPVYADHLSRALDLRLQRNVGALSKGEARRLQLVLALSHRPPLLLLDEPTDGLDPLVRNRALALLAEHLSDTPTTLLISTHHVTEVEKLADHVGVLRKGRLVAQMPRVELDRTVLRYHVQVPDGWEPAWDVRALGFRRSRGEAALTLFGDQHEMTERLTRAGAHVSHVTSLRLEETVLSLLAEEESR